MPAGKPQEKGIDVLCALACIREAERRDIDVVILASRDTDLVPVLDDLYDRRGEDPERFARVETVSWFDGEARRNGDFAGGSLRPTGGRRIWNTNLGRAEFEAARDRRVYR